MKTIIHVSDLSVPPERVFKALTTLGGLAAWWTTNVSGDAGPAGLIDFTFAGDFNPKLVVTSFDAPSRLSWRCIAGVGQWRENTFRFELQARDAGTRLRFRQDYASELSDDDYGSYNYHWGYYLESLRQYCETGAGKPFRASDSSPITPEDLVRRALGDLLDGRYLRAIDRYWSPDYTEHSVPSGQGLDGLRKLAESLPFGFRHERIRLFADGDLVVAHGLYHGLGPAPVVAFDLWRVDDGKIVEHWNGRQPWAAETVSGHTMVDGPAQVTKPDQTASSRSLVQDFVELIMMGRDRSQLGRFFDGDRFIQHNPLIADGVSGLGEAIQTGVWAAVIERTHHILAEGEFVFTYGEGTLHGNPTVFCDLFRVQDGKLAEHWDVVCAKPAPGPGRLPVSRARFDR
jgi:predicted SnoaL-like aldol condensation-catalyzing enzyme/uncharacterized protein YndB with AHSA1/START domain